MHAPQLEFALRLDVTLGPIREMGAGRAGHRRIVPIIGGKVTGPLATGHILPLGADWQTIFSDATAELDTRYAFETDDGATIEVSNYGFRHGPPEVIDAIARGKQVPPDAYYMRTHARLETGDARYDWINRTLFVGTGQRLETRVLVDLYAVR